MARRSKVKFDIDSIDLTKQDPIKNDEEVKKLIDEYHAMYILKGIKNKKRIIKLVHKMLNFLGWYYYDDGHWYNIWKDIDLKNKNKNKKKEEKKIEKEIEALV